MTRLVNAIRPAGVSPDYRFVRDADTGRLFKAQHHMEETPGRDPVLKLSIAEVDEDGKALRIAGTDEPEIVWHSHTFTPTELASPEFDVEKRVSAMLYTAIEDRDRRAAARQALSGLTDKWGGTKGLELEPPPPPLVPEQ